MPEPLIATYSKLMMHFKQSGRILTDAVAPSEKLQVEAEFINPLVIGGLNGPGCEFIPHNRGRHIPVAPLLKLGNGLWVWFGYHEEWNEEEQNRNIHKSRYSFRSVGLSIYFGPRNTVIKPKMFRAEWAGWAKWDRSDYSFQATNAAHPHWQFDALESLHDDDRSERAAQLLSRLRVEAEPEPEIRDFIPQFSEVEARDIVATQKLNRIHFASAGAWWKPPPHNNHIHSPNNLADVENWVSLSLNYIKLELGKL